MTPIFVSTDNALGSPRGDIDDAFALAALFASGVPIAAVASVFGNTSESRAFQNSVTLAAACDWPGSILRGAARAGEEPTDASRALAAMKAPLRIVALAPLTDLAGVLAVRPEAASAWTEVVVVGGNASSHGRWPPFWPHEFNLTKDTRSARAVFGSPAPVTVLPLDVARGMMIGRADLDALPGRVGACLREGSRRWLVRSCLLKGSNSFPVWDLVAALYAIDSASFEIAPSTALLHSNGWLEFGSGGREIRVLRAFDRDRLWRVFLDLLARWSTAGTETTLAPRRRGDGDL